MTDFILLGPRDQFLIRRLLETIPGFEESPEYVGLDTTERELPYLVAAGAKEYWHRLERAAQPGEPPRILSLLVEGLESLAADPDGALQDLVVEILTVLETDSSVTKRMRSRLGPNARALVEKFVD